MRILKETNSMILKCPSCNATLEVEKDDFKLLNEGDLGFSLCYICPICNQSTIVKIKDMPFPLFNELFKKYEEEMVYRLNSYYNDIINNKKLSLNTIKSDSK